MSSYTKYWSIVVAFLLVLYQARRSFMSRDNSDNDIFDRFGHDMLEPLPTNAIVLLLGDEFNNAAKYVHLCEKATNPPPSIHRLALVLIVVVVVVAVVVISRSLR